MTPTPQAPAPQANLELIELVAATMTAYYRDFADAAAREGLTPAQAKALASLRTPMSMRALADRLLCDASNVTGIIDRLESRDLVRRQPDEKDRRVKNVVATESGSQTMRRIRAQMTTTQAALDTLTEEERATLNTLLAKLRPAMECRLP
ncbi:MarR family winged helix-turn-helix transcriptional regulator [Wenjunlia tyrosinilytica]|uniref:MarR family transcriptional regulator n=1 Tax=Wenjunlia tyrosinilytica TaxID=1544741 RepID=A0A917ZII2_9ACTN|nr:MarR family transcriptional regulator [Wenjunlia tyrosinilytica]GGO82774.1 MarR family transcriptional regulator [Wenjunlia tyrosinilytica]